MSPRIVPLPYRKVERALRALGFQPIRHVGSHVRFAHPDGRAVTVPRHGDSEVRRGLLRKIIRDTRVPVDEFLRLV